MGSLLPFIGPSSAAVQLHQTGHSHRCEVSSGWSRSNLPNSWVLQSYRAELRVDGQAGTCPPIFKAPLIRKPLSKL
jgi:hypothetical protein